jgi:4'-phosphopantetheinyl transferase
VEFDYSDLSTKRPCLQTRRVASLVLARHLLVQAEILSQEESKGLKIERKSSGSPYLTHPLYSKHLLPSISISHSGSWVACLLSSPQTPAAIDIEDTTIMRRYQELSEYAFSDEENQFVSHYGKLSFYRLWTAKESIAKCQEKGLSKALKIDLGGQLEGPHLDNSYIVQSEERSYKLYQNMIEDNVYYCVCVALNFA